MLPIFARSYDRFLLPVVARSYDRFLGHLLAPFVRRPARGLPQPARVSHSPEAVAWPAGVDLQWAGDDGDELRQFQAPSPVDSPWPASRMMRGRALGAVDSRSAVIVLHGASDNEYRYSEWMGREFAKQEYRVLVPAAPCHLDRAEPHTFSGAPLFWSPELVVAGIAQWLAEVRGLIGWLRRQGVEMVGLVGYSLGSLVAGLAATLWNDLDFVALLAPVGHHLHAIHKSRVAAALWPWMRRIPPAQVRLLDRWAPLYRRPVVEHVLFLITLFDDLQPTELQRAWWRAWNQPSHREYRHGHMSVLFSKQLYRDLEQLASSRRRSVVSGAHGRPADVSGSHLGQEDQPII